MLKILKFWFPCFMFGECIQSDAVVVHSLIQVKNMQFAKW